jgi:AraC-like DNA-binding protein
LYLCVFNRRRIGPWMKGPFDVRHDTIEICAVLSGTSHVVVEGQAYTHGPGQVHILDAGVRHSSWTEEEPVEEVILHIRPECLPAGVQLQSGACYSSEALGLQAVLDATTSAEREEAVLAMLKRAANLPSTVQGLDPRLERLVLALSDDLRRRWTVDDMAAVAHTSQRTLRRLMQADLGTTPSAWLTDRKVRVASSLLRSTQLTVSDIAYRVGFGSPSRLTEAFTRLTGHSPSVWRQQQIERGSGG